MKPSTLLRLALAGTRADTLRVALTAVSAVLATLFLLAGATVASIRGTASQYDSNLLVEPGLRGGVVLALLLLTLPVLALAGQCGRLGAPARDRRLAAIRLAGATPRQAVALVASETGVAVALGAVIALGLYLIGRAVPADASLPTDVLPHPAVLTLLVAGLPVVAAAVAALLLRRVAVTPFGVVQRTRRRAPGAWPGLLIVPALAAFVLFEPAEALLGTTPGWVLPVLGGACGTIGVVLGTGWLSFAAGRILHRFARRPAALLAARRLMADPWSGSRTFAALLACVIFGAGAVTVRAWFAADFAAQAQLGLETDTGFYFSSLDLVDTAILIGMVIAAAGLLVTLAEGIVSRRRVYARLVATGVPRGTLARSILWQAVAPILPAIVLALAVGYSLIRGVSGADEAAGTSQVCDERGCRSATFEFVIPFSDLALVGGIALIAVLAVVGLGLLFLRASTSLEELRTG
jgi:hypothetical protein